MVLLDGPLTLCDAMTYEDANKWELASHARGVQIIDDEWHMGIDPIPKNYSLIGCKWMFCAKTDALGHVVHYKARLVALCNGG